MDWIAFGEDSGFIGRYENENEAVEALNGEHGWIYKYMLTAN